ncbi:uncharacterized protein LOC131670416 [Phymastichus coffea]|uniref:uncharacterized protein LOC131670416 n=1 Tax=Phymastichus coffea TaxID=108790 RepID=UPI00273C2B18|nr:uncharacterized protein LOC131670416 [Phymastichus coffea]
MKGPAPDILFYYRDSGLAWSHREHDRGPFVANVMRNGELENLALPEVSSLAEIALLLLVGASLRSQAYAATKCQGTGLGLKYVWGDALTDSTDCLGPNNMQYPTGAIARNFKSTWPGSSRTARHYQPRTIDPELTRQALLNNYRAAHGDYSIADSSRSARSYSTKDTCGSPSRLCKTRYNTTAPMYGVSLTSGQPVTIVQKFPDLLQQVVFEVCESKECDIVHGECTQTYVPYLFLVIPLGPVTLTGQDYVLVESGCVCKPKNTLGSSSSSDLPAVPPF